MQGVTIAEQEPERLGSRTTRLVSAIQLQAMGILKKGTAYKLANTGLIPSYNVGVKQRGVRFIAEEVLEALRRPGPQIKKM